jgi:hypothetical protein
MNDESYPFDEDVEKVEIEEEAGESVLRNERESIWDSINKGISYQHLELNNII